MRKHKFRPGRTIRTLTDAVRRIDKGEWIYFNHKPQHPGWMLSVQLQTIRASVQRGFLRQAIRNKEEANV